jgi:hypothetical protein
VGSKFVEAECVRAGPWQSPLRKCANICKDLQSSTARPAIIGRNLSTFGETIGEVKPGLNETQPTSAKVIVFVIGNLSLTIGC